MLIVAMDINGSNEAVANGNFYQKIGFTRARFDGAPCFSTTTSTLTPPAGNVIFGGQLFLTSGFNPSGNPNIVAKIIKNGTFSGGVCTGGTDVQTGIAYVTTVPYCVAVQLPMIVDQASGSDYYNLCLYCLVPAGSGTLTLDGNPAHTYWNAMW